MRLVAIPFSHAGSTPTVGRLAGGQCTAKESARRFKRHVLAGTIRSALDGAGLRGQKIDENQAKDWIKQAQDLIDQAHALPQ